MRVSNYWRRVKDHPGVGIASIMTMFGFLAGMMRDEGLAGGVFGMLVMGLFCWTPVLLTARRRNQ